VLSDYIGLQFVKADHLIRGESSEIKVMAWIGLCNGQVWQIDLIETVILY